MVEHLTFINFTNEEIEDKKVELIEKVKAFNNHIPGVIDAQAGENFKEGFDFGISIRFKDKKSLEEYIPHPKHQEVASLLREMGMSDFTVVDFEF